MKVDAIFSDVTGKVKEMRTDRWMIEIPPRARCDRVAAISGKRPMDYRDAAIITARLDSILMNVRASPRLAGGSVRWPDLNESRRDRMIGKIAGIGWPPISLDRCGRPIESDGFLERKCQMYGAS
jgi:hypothetical protein